MIFHLTAPVYGQMGISFDFKKPKEYEERTLRSERTDLKKFTLPKRFLQNTVTHYNYFFNANVKLNEVIEKAKLSFVDDYSQLLPFYNYELDVIDVYQQPLLAQSEQVLALPLLIKVSPLPLKRLIGNMSDTEKVLKGLQLNEL